MSKWGILSNGAVLTALILNLAPVAVLGYAPNQARSAAVESNPAGGAFTGFTDEDTRQRVRRLRVARTVGNTITERTDWGNSASHRMGLSQPPAVAGYDLDAIGSQQYSLATGLQVLYTFREGSGTTVHDVSGVGDPLDLEISDGSAVSWISGGGLVVDSATLIASVGPATKVISACQGSDEITIEAWVRPANTTQDGPARIVTLSQDTGNSNFTLGQGLWGGQPAARYDVRLRTTATSDNGTPSLTTPDGSLTTELTHVVYTRDASGEARIYVNDVEQASGTVGGDLSNWGEGFRLALANELTGGRPWLGEFHQVAIYSSALSPSIAIEKTADPTMIYTADPVTYTYSVTNHGDGPLSGVVVSDDRCSFVSGPTEAGGNGDDVLDLGEVWGYTCTMTLEQDTANIATVTATDPLSQVVRNSDIAFVDVIHPGIAIAKLPDTQMVVSDTNAIFTITVTNTGDIILDNVTVVDVLASDCDADLGSLDVRDRATYTCLARVTADLTNTAAVTGTPPVGDAVSASDSADVTVIYPDISITKMVNWNGVTPDESQEFEICISGPSYPSRDCRMVGYSGSTLFWSDLIPGDYIVTETNPGAEWDVTIIGSPATVPEDGGVIGAVVVNARRLGSLAVTKTVAWNGVTPDESQEFEICITGPSYPDENCRTVDYSGGTLSWRDLIPGDYIVTETNPGAEWDVTIIGSPATVPENGGVTGAIVINARRLGGLAVTKTVAWNGVTPDVRQQFTICIEGASYPSVDCQSVGHTGGILPWSNLIPGDYIITEFDPGAEWDTTITGSPATVPEDGGSAGAVVANARRLGSLTVAKVVDWDDIAPDVSQQFTICVEGPTLPSVDCRTVGYDGGDLRWDNLVPGDYIITEIDPGGTWFVEVAGSPATVPAEGGSVSATVTNTHQLGWLRVTKTVDWGLGVPDSSKQFTICIAGPSYPTSDCRTIGHTGGILSWDGLVPGDYVVTENDPGERWKVDVEGSPATVPDDGSGVSVNISNRSEGGTVYLPLVTRKLVASAPDLVVDDILVTSDSAQVVIKNVGDAPVLPTDAFWVDLYVDPDPVPTSVNQTWAHLCDKGIVWGVTMPALPLQPGGTITLAIGDVYYWEDYSYFPGSLPPGTPIYVQVDSANVQTTYGAVLENHEIAGGSYNNIAGPVSSIGGAWGQVSQAVEPSAGVGRPPVSLRRMPPRP